MDRQRRDINEVSRSLARLKTEALALVCAVIGGVGLFLMTVWLVIKDGPAAGAHLGLLSNYFAGYSVTWVGSIIGLLYGGLSGGIIGWAVGTMYNKIVNLRKT